MHWNEHKSQPYLSWDSTHQYNHPLQTPTYLTCLILFLHFWQLQLQRMHPWPHLTSPSHSDQMCWESPLQHIRPGLFPYPTPPFWQCFRNAQEQQPTIMAYHLTFWKTHFQSTNSDWKEIWEDTWKVEAWQRQNVENKIIPRVLVFILRSFSVSSLFHDKRVKPMGVDNQGTSVPVTHIVIVS